MSKAFAVLGLAVGLAIGTVAPALAGEIHSYSQSSQTTVGAPQVMESWMQPTVVRSTQEIDASGNAQVRQEPLIMERHERVMIPQEDRSSTTVVNKEETPVVTTSTTTASRSYVASRPIAHRSCVAHRRVAYRYPSRSLAYNTVKRKDIATTTSSSEQVDHNERVEQKATIFERRDPALDLY